MELLSPDFGIIVWIIITAFCCGLTLAALLMMIPNKTMSSAFKAKWTFIILLAPVVGAILFFSLPGTFIKKKTY